MLSSDTSVLRIFEDQKWGKYRNDGTTTTTPNINRFDWCFYFQVFCLPNHSFGFIVFVQSKWFFSLASLSSPIFIQFTTLFSTRYLQLLFRFFYLPHKMSFVSSLLSRSESLASQPVQTGPNGSNFLHDAGNVGNTTNTTAWNVNNNILNKRNWKNNEKKAELLATNWNELSFQHKAKYLYVESISNKCLTLSLSNVI